MSEAGHMDVTPAQVSNQNGKDSCVKQTTSEQALEIGCRSVCSVSSDQKHDSSSEVVPKEQGEIKNAPSSGVDDEELQPPSEDVLKNSVIEHLGRPSGDATNSQTGKNSHDEQVTLVQAYEFGSRSVCSGPSEQEHELGSEPVPSVPVETSEAVSGCIVIEQVVPPSEDKTKDSFIEKLEPSPVDVSKSSLAEIDSCPAHITSEVEHGLASGSIHSGPSEQKNQPAFGSLQSETLETSSIVSRSVTIEQLGPPSEALTIDHLIESTGVPPEDAAKTPTPETSAPPSEDEIKDYLIEQLEPPRVNVSKTSMAERGTCPMQIAPEQGHEFGSKSVHSGPSEQKNQIASEPVESETIETCYAVSTCVAVEQLGPPSEVPTVSSLIENKGLSPEDTAKTPSPVQIAQPSANVEKHSSFEEFGTPPKNTIDYSSPSRSQDKKSSKLLKKKHRLRSVVGSDRVLRPRSEEKPKAPESSNNLVNASTETKQEKKKKKQRRVRNTRASEFLRIRQRLRYLQNKIGYEQSLIDAYSGEGWKGLSLEKLKPEKELQRAKSEILRRKLKIRDLFQHLDSLCAEGRIPESLFDSEGEIESEDIFCAKCGSKDVTLDNDIVLCDGACERAFHQFCLEPPLRKEDIPPDNEGWLCPGCDCKVDCIDLLNDSQGTNLSVTDSWEKVFPEVAATAGQNQDNNFGLPSDDSEDDDYDPDGPETDEKVQEDDSSSDESHYTTASDDLETPANEDQFLGLPSDDSEDDDYDPSGIDHDEKVKQESSSSDFTSDSEDLGAALDHNMSSGKDEDPTCSSLGSIRSHRGSGGRRSRVDDRKQSINEELSSILESDPGQEGAAPVSGKRHVERLDYKKLHDETYENVPSDSSDDENWTAKETSGNVPSDSSDDEDWTDTVAPKKRKKTTTGEVAPVPSNVDAPVLKDETDAKDTKHELREPVHTPKKRTRQKRNSEDTNGLPAKTDNDSIASGSSGKRARSSSNRRLGEAATQKLYKSFKENQYPDRATKERLAAELEMTVQQVAKWFDNYRWSFRHSSCTEPCSTACPARNSSRKRTPLPEKNDKPPEVGPEMVTRDATCNGAENNETPKASTEIPERSSEDKGAKLVSPGSSIKDSRKRKGELAYLESMKDSSIEETPTPPARSPKAPEVQRGRTIQTRSRKSTG